MNHKARKTPPPEPLPKKEYSDEELNDFIDRWDKPPERKPLQQLDEVHQKIDRLVEKHYPGKVR